MHRHYIIIAFCFLWMLQPTCPAQGQTIFGYRTNDNAFLGVTADQISKRKVQLLGLENRYGEYITSIVEGSAAEKAGLLPLDFLTGINDEELDWSTDLSDLLGQYQAGDEVNIHFVRKGKTMTKLVTLGKRRSTNWNMSSFSFPQNNNEPFLGISKHDAHSDYELGVRVNIIDMSTADDLGMKDGDVILKINDYPMVDWEDISGAIDMLQVGDNINLEWERVGKSYKQSGTIKSKANRNSSRYSFSTSGYNNTSDYAFLGIYSSPISKEKAKKLNFDNPYGSYVTAVMERSTAEQAGLQPFDYIYGIDEYRTGRDQNLTDILRKYDIGENATLHFIRKGEYVKSQVTFGDRDKARSISKSGCDDPFLGVQQSMSNRLDEGVQVQVIEESTAFAAGLQDGDAITKINGYPILDWEDLSTAVDAMYVGEEAVLEYQRNGKRLEGTAIVQSDCARKRSGNRYMNLNFDDLRVNIFGERKDKDNQRSRNAESMELHLRDISSSEVREINRELELELPAKNDLPVKKLRMEMNQGMNMYQLTFTLDRIGDTKVRVHNNSGRQIYAYDLGGFQGDFSDEIDLARNGPGDYYLTIEQDEQAFVQKIKLTKI